MYTVFAHMTQWSKNHRHDNYCKDILEIQYNFYWISPTMRLTGILIEVTTIFLIDVTVLSRETFEPHINGDKIYVNSAM